MTDQLIQQATRHAAHLERLKAGEVKKVREFLTKIEAGILRQLAGQELVEWTKTDLNQQLKLIRELMKSEIKDFQAVWEKQVTDLGQYEMDFEARSIENVVKVNMTLPTIEQVGVAVFNSPLSVEGPDRGKLLRPFFRDWTDREISRIAGEVRLGYAQGKTTQEVITAIKGSRSTPGALKISQRALETMTRTALQHSAVVAREETWRKNQDVVKKVEWFSVLDSRTSVQCRSLDGTQYEIGKGPRPPIHPGCRSTTVAVLDDDLQIFDQGGTRRARDPESGQLERVGADQTYYGWLKTQPANVQDSIIGETRGKLLRNGGLSSKRFAELNLNKDFTPATLDDMRSLEPAAFEKAGI